MPAKKKPATYADLVALPPHLVGEIVLGYTKKSMSKSVTAPRRQPARASRAVRSALRDQPLPKAAFPTLKEIEELGRFGDRVASGKVKLKYIKL